MNGLKFGVVVFPGSNCDHDAFYAMSEIFKLETVFLWHKNTSIEDCDVVILPGGFSYGDYLRCGAIARFSPIMKEVVAFANRGGIVIGICNGFQTLCECDLLPGALLRNESLTFECKYINVRVEQTESLFTSVCSASEVLSLPIAHGEGNYYADDETLDRLEANGQVFLRYCDRSGKITRDANPNGSSRNIAGIVNERGNIMGMMPHPERAVDPVLGHVDGKKILYSLIHSLQYQEQLAGRLAAERS
jgi:phosphoribosylformylglycinamidine synthase